VLRILLQRLPGDDPGTPWVFAIDDSPTKRYRPHLNITSWSMALALLSLVLPDTGWWLGRKPAPAVEPLAIGGGAG
jgi:hypothetical protein